MQILIEHHRLKREIFRKDTFSFYKHFYPLKCCIILENTQWLKFCNIKVLLYQHTVYTKRILMQFLYKNTN